MQQAEERNLHPAFTPQNIPDNVSHEIYYQVRVFLWTAYFFQELQNAHRSHPPRTGFGVALQQ